MNVPDPHRSSYKGCAPFSRVFSTGADELANDSLVTKIGSVAKPICRRRREESHSAGKENNESRHLDSYKKTVAKAKANHAISQ